MFIFSLKDAETRAANAEDDVSTLRRDVAMLRSQLVAKDEMFRQDARARLQLGKKLQQLLLENAELRREKEEISDKMATVRRRVSEARISQPALSPAAAALMQEQGNK